MRRALLMFFILFLGGCTAVQGQAPAVLPTVNLDSSAPAAAPSTTETSVDPRPVANGVTASGTVLPASQVTLSPAIPGIVAEVLAKKGDQVQAGETLVRLAGNQKLQAAIAAAELELLSAQTALANLYNSAGLTLGQAQVRLAIANDELDKAEKRRQSKEFRVGSDTQVNLAKADLIMAKDSLKQAEDMYDWVKDTPDDNLNKASALSALSAARLAYDKAESNLNYVLSIPNPIEVAKADATLTLAKAEAEAAQTALNKLKDGLDPAMLAQAQARVTNAEAQLAAAKSALADMEITTPFAGTLIELEAQPGQWLAPGMPAAVIYDLSELEVKTTDLSERDVVDVQTGANVQVTVKALGITVEGKVKEIANQAEILGGDVVYPVTITLPQPPEGLKPGMSVEVKF